MIAAILFTMANVLPHGPTLGIEGTHFTLDGKPTFLIGCSYYGALAMDDETAIRSDLASLQEFGFNWIRVWATWNAYDNNVSAVDANGDARELYMARLQRFVALAGEFGMVVDVTVARGEAPLLKSMGPHLQAMKTLATALKPSRNVYFDVGNERDVGDARHVPLEEVGQLIDAVKVIDVDRLCTASSVPSAGDVVRYFSVGKLDFVAPHLSRTAQSPAETEGYTRRLLAVMKDAGCEAPIHFQEPFRRGYADWEPSAEDFITDLTGALQGGAAGWCFHNGGNRKVDDERPRRSFDMRKGEGRLMVQIDAEETRFLRLMHAMLPRLAQWPDPPISPVERQEP